VLSLLLHGLQLLGLSISFQVDSFGHHLGVLLLHISNPLLVVRISFSLDPCRLSPRIHDNVRLNQLSLGQNLIVLDCGLSFDLVDHDFGVFIDFSLYLLLLSLNVSYLFFDFLELDLGSTLLIEPLLLPHAFQELQLLLIVLYPEVITDCLPLQGVLILEDSLLLHAPSHILWQLHIRDDHSRNLDASCLHDIIKMSKHGSSVLFSSDRVYFLGALGSYHCSASFSDGSIQHLSQFIDIQAHLVDILVFLLDLKHDGDMDIAEDVV